MICCYVNLFSADIWAGVGVCWANESQNHISKCQKMGIMMSSHITARLISRARLTNRIGLIHQRVILYSNHHFFIPYLILVIHPFFFFPNPTSHNHLPKILLFYSSLVNDYD